jgi:hypothetical protein
VRTISAVLCTALLASGCASRTRPENILIGVGSGAVAGAVGGAALSPNEPSKPWNALIFGLTGALIGGALGYMARSKEPDPGRQQQDLKMREQTSLKGGSVSVYPPMNGPLPDFLKDRLTSMVIEELSMPSRVGEDGTLHEPHKAYRIKRSPELLPAPNKASGNAKGTKK